jgi:uncharacterized membrane protein (DUF106 family)
MHTINVLIGAVLDTLLRPFHAWPLVGLIVVSLLVAIALVGVFKLTSNQRALADAKRQVQASLFELRLFQEDPVAVLRAAGRLLRHQGRYLRYASVPLLWMGLPLALLVTHLQARYGYDGLYPGQSAIVTVRMKTEAAASRPALAIDAPQDGLRIETPGVWVPSLREMAWRVAAVRDGGYGLTVTLPASADVTKQVVVGASVAARATVRPEPTIGEQFAYPVEAPLPADSAIEAITIAYPPRALDVFGVPLHWIVLFIVLSMGFAFVLRPVFGVVF